MNTAYHLERQAFEARAGRAKGRQQRAETEERLPFPAFEKVGDGEAEAGENILAFQESGGANDAAVCARVADFQKLFIGVDNPNDPCATGEEVGQAFVHLRAGVARGEDFNRQVGCARKKGLGVGLETQPEQALFRDKRNIRRAAVPVFHPKPHAGTEHRAEPVEAVENADGANSCDS